MYSLLSMFVFNHCFWRWSLCSRAKMIIKNKKGLRPPMSPQLGVPLIPFASHHDRSYLHEWHCERRQKMHPHVAIGIYPLPPSPRSTTTSFIGSYAWALHHARMRERVSHRHNSGGWRLERDVIMRINAKTPLYISSTMLGWDGPHNSVTSSTDWPLTKSASKNIHHF